jgi:hypothetical protein
MKKSFPKLGEEPFFVYILKRYEGDPLSPQRGRQHVGSIPLTPFPRRDPTRRRADPHQGGGNLTIRGEKTKKLVVSSFSNDVTKNQFTG